ncbi:Protein csh3 [Vermiconidia calcicola]|uniref:Protein csh3 n=1 Tax=Vermiconidia calcicola TaxID=1690605 RepID=A0ACC3MQL0_9PEZI|nr:Protein csh3 [Vermiconidia calcicola]
MSLKGIGPFATFLIIGPTCFFLGILFAGLPYDYYVLWSTPNAIAEQPNVDPRSAYFDMQENHLKFLHSSAPLISRMLHIVIATGILGLLMKLYKPTEANKLFDGASLVLYMIGVTVYIANIVKGMRTVSAGAYGNMELAEGETFKDKVLYEGNEPAAYIGREDSLRVVSASNTILAMVLIGILVLQAGQWYAQRKESEEIEQLDNARDEKRKEKSEKAGKKKQ